MNNLGQESMYHTAETAASMVDQFIHKLTSVCSCLWNMYLINDILPMCVPPDGGSQALHECLFISSSPMSVSMEDDATWWESMDIQHIAISG